ncbi:sodium:solute symporter [Tunicatimonas pelagia]|uniref:sodium:solute symporter n=1 Tax=Tunicatimonas pelagia TaxID=931531 RepID=UPI002666C0CA|nr:sodium:solute symporter [Tunicatimonas pelagia]WKN44201.1 sodium:solute symporter [Tunicatimonas pelagia]
MPSPSFGWINYTVVGAYLALLVALGFYFSRRRSTTDDYFRAGQRVPWWAAGLSIFGTQLSASTFMAIPAKTFATDWAYFMLNMTIIMVSPLIVFVFLPFFRRLNVTTAYEYLEKRFNLATRLLGSLMFIGLQLGRVGIVIYLPAIALSLVTGVDVRWCIILMGTLSILYTVLGGIEAVIWTDVLQVVVLLGGALFCLVYFGFSIEGGYDRIWEAAQNDDKFNLFDFRFDFTQPTFWVVVLGGVGANIVSYGSDQAVVQRYLTTRNERNAARGIWTDAALTLPATLIFFGIGTALYVFYLQQVPDVVQATPDAIFPYFIVSELPPGIAGLLIAGVFAAAMSSLDSSMNSVATVVTTDFYRRLNSTATERRYLRVAQGSTAAIGIIGTMMALLLTQWDIQSLWDQLNTFIGLFAGGLAGVFLLGMFTRRANGPGAVAGILTSALVQWSVAAFTDMHLLLYATSGLVSAFMVGYATSLLTSKPSKDLNRLTIYTLLKESKTNSTE